MKIEGARGVGAAGGARGAGRTAAPGFAPSVEGPARAATTSAAHAVTPLDALLALQAEGFDPQRRRRQVRRGTDVLDALEELARGIALGRAPAGLRAELENLKRGAETTGEPGLDAALLEIDTRLAVELAKLEMAAA